MQLRINYNNILFQREVKQIIPYAFSPQLSAVSFMKYNNTLYYSSESKAIGLI